MKKWPIYLLEAPSVIELNTTFVRFQEYYESPKFRGTIFSLEEFREWDAKENEGRISYFKYWRGNNIPSYIFKPFREGAFDPLSQEEKLLLEKLGGIPEPFYVITVVQDDDLDILQHEFVHGLYYFDPQYRQEVIASITTYELGRYWPALRKMGYRRDVIDDEINAYATTDLSDLIDAGLDPKDGLATQIVLRKLFSDYFGYSIEDQSREDLYKRVHVLPWQTPPKE